MSRPTRATAGGRAYLDLQNLARREERSTQELLVLYVLAAPREVRPQGRHAPGRAQRPPPDRRRRSARDPPEQPDREVLARVTEIASTTITPEDGVRYLTDTAKARIIREGDLYSGIRVTMNATVADAGVKLQLDINFGDPMTPAPSTITYPGLRDEFPPVRILGYPLPTVLAEKLTTAIRLGAGNSRIRDVADVWTLTGVHDLDATQMRAALETTAAHRQITLRPLAVSLVDLATARADTYTTYRRRLGQAGAHLPEDLTTLIGDVITFVDPLLQGEAAPHWDAKSRRWTT